MSWRGTALGLRRWARRQDLNIYTKTGDDGRTGLLGGTRVPKDHPRVEAYGDFDELSALLGLVRARSTDADLEDLLRAIQADLLALGASLARPDGQEGADAPKARIQKEHVARLERAVDEREAGLPPLTAFILPGGSVTGALLHVARAVCRRTERAVVRLAREESVDPNILAYVNRLSDLLFVLARCANLSAGSAEVRW